VPIYGGQIAQEVTADEKPPRAGLVGKVRDKLEDAHILNPADESSRGALGREAIAALKARKESAAEEGKRSATMLTDKPKESLDVRLKKALKSGARTDFEALIIEALSSGDRQKAFQIAGEAAKSNIRFTRRHMSQLEGRVIPRPGDEEP
jgi:hypothetical protein